MNKFAHIPPLELKIKVPFTFKLFFGRKLISNSALFSQILGSESESRVMFFIEEKLAHLHKNLLTQIATVFANKNKGKLATAPIIMPGGEKNKNIEHVLEICSHISRNELCRHSFVVAIGGGAFLDTVCFAASITHRGIKQLRFPSTVLSQCDSGVGVKNAVNLFGKKNYIGTFHPPVAVVNDFALLDSLPLREKIAGIAETIKVAIIKDREFFNTIRDNAPLIRKGDITVYEDIIIRSAELHATHITNSGDPFELGSARPLDFGHWIAHKLESMSNGKIRHGEAVSIGIASDSFYAMKNSLITCDEFEEIIKLLSDCGLPLWSSFLDKNSKGRRDILNGLAEFREHLGGRLSITLPKSIGKKIEIDSLDETLIIEGFNHLKAIHR